MKQQSVTYVYCLVRSDAAPPVGSAPAGLAGLGPLRALAAGEGMWILAAAAPLPDFEPARIEARLEDVDEVARLATAHQAVIEHFMEHGTVLPMKLFTMFADEAGAVARIHEEQPRVAEALDRVEGCQEWGIRVVFESARALAAERAKVRDEAGPTSSGRSFLMMKKGQRDAARRLSSRVHEQVEALYDDLAARARSAIRRPAAASGDAATRIVLDAAFLVPRGEADAFERALAGRAEGLHEDGYDLTLTGPWPPYHFVEGV